MGPIRILGASLLFALGGCALNRQIDIRDGPLLFPTLRASLEFDRSNAPGRTDAGEHQAAGEKPSLGLEADFSGMDAADGGYDYRVLEAGLALRSTYRMGESTRLQALTGMGWHSLRVDGWEDDGYGPYLGVAARWRVSDRVEPYLRFTFLWTFDAQSVQVEGGIGFRLTDHLRALVGYRYWEFDSFDVLGGTDVDLEAHGPVLGLTLDF